MQKSTYHIAIVSLYAVLCVYIFFFTELLQSYFTFSFKDLALLPLFIASALIVFFVANSILKFGTIGLNNKNIARLPLISLYASILISIPEEILFRGLIQTYLYSISYDVILPLLISSLIFGLSHILNGAKGISPSKWNGKLVVMTFLAGIFLGYSFYITGSLVVPIVLHTVFILIIKVFIKDEVKV